MKEVTQEELKQDYEKVLERTGGVVYRTYVGDDGKIVIVKMINCKAVIENDFEKGVAVIWGQEEDDPHGYEDYFIPAMWDEGVTCGWYETLEEAEDEAEAWENDTTDEDAWRHWRYTECGIWPKPITD